MPLYNLMPVYIHAHTQKNLQMAPFTYTFTIQLDICKYKPYDKTKMTILLL